MSISSYANLHRGDTVMILGNGPSLPINPHIPVRWSIGTNRSWKRHTSAYHLVAELEHLMRAPGEYVHMASQNRLWVIGRGFPYGHVIPLIEARNGVEPFSRDMERGVVVSHGDVGSVVYAAIQMAAWMGFSKIYLLGVDLHGDHFDGSKASKELERQNELFRLVPEDVRSRVFIAGSPESMCDVFEKVSFEEVCA